MSAKHKWIKRGLPLLVLLLGVVAMQVMVRRRPEPRREVREDRGVLVEVVVVEHRPHRIEIEATGTVQPRREISLIPQVSGRVSRMAENFVAGGFFRRGELLFEIETADYRLAVDKAQAALARAEYDLATVEGQARVARREWQQLQARLEPPAEPNPLVLFEPQLDNARAALRAAAADLERARLDLERTRLRSPFNAVVRTRGVDLGQYLRAGTEVANLVGTDQAEVVVPLPLEELVWLRIPRDADISQGSAATVELQATGRRHRWSGRVVRRLADVDPVGRMVRLVVAVDDPYGLSESDTERPDLGMGTFVRVLLQGPLLDEVAVLPAAALRKDSRVWLWQEGRLHIRSVEVWHRTREQVVIGAGLLPGERVVTSPLSGAVEGMRLRLAAAEPELPAADSADGVP